MKKSRDRALKRLIPLLVLTPIFFLPGCGSIQTTAASPTSELATGNLRVADVLVKEGLEKLGQHRYEDASRIFNAGLKFSPANAQLHFLNGLTYHLLYLRGDEGKKEYAVTGYKLALSYDPAHYHAALQLGRLEFEARRYENSAEAFRHSIEIEPQNGEGHFGLAAAAYYARDLVGARAAVEKATDLLPESAEAVRASAMIYAALGEQAKSREAASRYAVLEKRPGARDRLNTRVEQWRAWHTSLPATKDDQARRDPATLLAQIYAPPSADDTAQAASINPEPKPVPGAARRAWFECGTDSYTSSPTFSAGYAGGDETAPLPTLPSPCQGAANPRMVVLDTAFIRTENNASTSHGINLLDGLTYVFNQSRELRDFVGRQSSSDGLDSDSRNITITRARSRGLPSNGIKYSLNIANSTDARTEVLANPSLVAMDRMPSMFFAGNNVTLGIAGGYGSSSSVTDRPVGISLSVTPTFIDNGTVLLAVKAVRSFVEPVNQAVMFEKTLQTSRNAVTANVVLEMGQTLILSGLSEQEIQRNSEGVPVLKDIPVLQYLFGTKVVQNFTRSVLVLITPRMPAYDGDVMARTVKHIDTLSGDKAGYRPFVEQALKTAPDSAQGSLDGVYKHSFGNQLFLQFRAGDVGMQHWSEPSRLDALFRSLAELLYF
jgi:tetratricopeptide (TPR) repeat protein